ncbi:hypothetical protein ABKV19_024399, partial [Rosa sericea]
KKNILSTTTWRLLSSFKEYILKWGIPNKIDMIALSFVRKGSDLVEVRKLLGKHAKNILLMLKVENLEGVANFDNILANSDAFMVARGRGGPEVVQVVRPH